MEKTAWNGLFRHYSSLEKALRAVYTDYPWESSQFAREYIHNKSSSQKELLEDVARKLGIKEVLCCQGGKSFFG